MSFIHVDFMFASNEMDLNTTDQYSNIQSLVGLNYFVPTNFYPTFMSYSFPTSQVTFIQTPEENLNQITPCVMPVNVANSLNVITPQIFQTEKPPEIFKIADAPIRIRKETGNSILPSPATEYIANGMIPKENSYADRSSMISGSVKTNATSNIKMERENSMTPIETQGCAANSINIKTKPNSRTEKSLGSSKSLFRPQYCKINELIKNKSILRTLIKNKNESGTSVSTKVNKTTAKEPQTVTHRIPKVEENLQLKKSIKTYDRANIKKTLFKIRTDNSKDNSESKKFSTEDRLELRKSVKTYGNVKSECLFCGICNKKFPSHQMLQNGNTYFCHTCHELRTLQNTTLIDQEKENMCNLCHDLFQNSVSVIRHVKSVHHLGSSSKSLCDICSKQVTEIFHHRKSHFLFSSSAETLIEEREEDLACKVCWKRFNRKESLEIHSRIHTRNNKPYTCKLCHKKFINATDFTEHLQEMHPKKKRKYFSCKFCLKRFLSWKLFIDHVNHHRGITPYKCKHCDLKFSGRSRRNYHYKTQHSEKQFYTCEFCNKVFSNPNLLKRHVNLHLNVRPHKCEICSKAFSHLHLLKIHRRSHTGEKPYVCDVCYKGFSMYNNYKVHYRIHTGEKPFVCEICDKAFRVKLILNEHYKTHKRNSKKSV